MRDPAAPGHAGVLRIESAEPSQPKGRSSLTRGHPS